MLVSDFVGAVDVSAFTNALASAIRDVSSAQQVDAGRNIDASNIGVVRISEAPGDRFVVGWDFVGLSDADRLALEQLLQKFGESVAPKVNQQLQQTSPGTGTLSPYRGTNEYFHNTGGISLPVSVSASVFVCVCCGDAFHFFLFVPILFSSIFSSHLNFFLQAKTCNRLFRGSLLA